MPEISTGLESTESHKPVTPTETAPPSDPSQESAADILAGLLSPDNKASIRTADGLELPSERQPAVPEAQPTQLDPESQLYIDQATQRLETEQTNREELAERRAHDVLADPDATDQDKYVALHTLREQSPTRYQALLDRADDEALDDFLSYDPEADPDVAFPHGLPGQQAGQTVERMETYLRDALLTDSITSLQRRAQEERATVVAQHYRGEGANSDEEIVARYQLDRQILGQQGIDTASLKPADLKDVLGTLSAATEVHQAEQKRWALQQSVMEAPTTNVSDGFERVNDQGELVSMNPKLHFKGLSDAEFARRVEAAKAQQPKQQRTPEERMKVFREEMSKPDSTSVKDGWELNGKPYDLEGEKAKVEREKQVQLQRERAAELGLR